MAAKEENKRSTASIVGWTILFIAVIAALGYIGAKFNLLALFMVAQ